MSSVGDTAHTVSGWSRFLGVSLRPWSGESPASLIFRGLIQLAVCIFFFVLLTRVPAAVAEMEGAGDLNFLRGVFWFAAIALVIIGVLALLRVVIGVIDFIPRRTITGTVVSLTNRKVGDFLPHIAQRIVFMRRDSGIDQRKTRAELVLQTNTGLRQWTVRSARVRKDLHVGEHVQLSVTPLTGYVARVDQVTL